MEPSQDAADPAEEGRPTPKGGVLQLHNGVVTLSRLHLVAIKPTSYYKT